MMTDRDSVTALLLSGKRYSGNPYMELLTDGLEHAGVDVRYPENRLVLPATRAALRHRDADVVQFDWLYPHYMISSFESEAMNKLFTVVRGVTFLVDLLLVSLLPVELVRVVHNKRHHEGRYPRLERVVTEWNFYLADAVTVKCDRAVDVVASHYAAAAPERMHVVPDGSYVSAYENDVSRGEARDDLSIPDDAFVFLFFGQIREYKGVPDLLRAFDGFEHPDARLWVVGNPKSDRLRREIDDLASRTANVETVLEFVPENRIQYYMNAADALVLPYREILNSGTAYAGMSFGLPVVAPAMGCLPETLPPENEFLYDPETGDALRRELERAYDHPDIDGVGRANYEHALENSWDRVAERFVGVYRSAMDDPAGDATATATTEHRDTTD